VRGAAVWALGRLDPMRIKAIADGHFARESDPSVRDEWKAA
jgi:epoxyqueuosine reductase